MSFFLTFFTLKQKVGKKSATVNDRSMYHGLFRVLHGIGLFPY